MLRMRRGGGGMRPNKLLAINDRKRKKNALDKSKMNK